MIYVIKDGNCESLFGYEVDITGPIPKTLVVHKDGEEREVDVDRVLLDTPTRKVVQNSNYTAYLRKK